MIEMSIGSGRCRRIDLADERRQIGVLVGRFFEQGIADVHAIVRRTGAQTVGRTHYPDGLRRVVARYDRRLRVDEEARSERRITFVSSEESTVLRSYSHGCDLAQPSDRTSA